MKIARLFLVVTIFTVGVATAIPTTKTVREGEVEYDIVIPSIVVPDVMYPDIRLVELAEIVVMKPEVALNVFMQANRRGNLFDDTTKTIALIQRLNVSGIGKTLPVIYSSLKRAKPIEIGRIVETFEVIIDRITTLTPEEAEQVMAGLSPRGTFYGQEKEFYNAWVDKDFTEIKNILANISREQAGFFTAWGEDKDISQVDIYNPETMFPYQAFYVYTLGPAWEKEFNPRGKFILVINFAISAIEVKSLLELIEKHQEQIKMVILPWGSHNEFVNNFDNRNISTYPEIAGWCDRLFYSIKEIKPDLPVYLTVSFTSRTMDVWIKSFKAKYDGIALWNITSPKANFSKIFNQVKKYNPNIILSGMFGFSFKNYPKNKISWDEVRDLIPETSNKIRDAGFRGVVWIKH